MQIKATGEQGRRENQAEETLRRLSNTSSTQKQSVTTPVRKKTEWVMDAWEDGEEDYTPQLQSARSALRTPNRPYNGQTLALRDRSASNQKQFCTPRSAKDSPARFQKENKYRSRILTGPYYRRVHKDIQPCSFKTPLSAIQYPLTRVPPKTTHRAEKYRSFIARTLRK